MDKVKCVYKLKCRDTNITEFYIGSSLNFQQRKSQHKGGSNNLNDRHYCYPLYMFINVNGGIDNWEFEVIKEYKFITKKELNIEEQKFKDLLKPQLNISNVIGLDLEKRKINIKNYNSKKENCPHCNKEMLKTSIPRHIKDWCKSISFNIQKNI